MDKSEIVQKALNFKFGGMSKFELSNLYDICNNKNVLELGSMAGMSSYVIANVANHLDCVDVWSDTQEHLSHDPLQASIYQQYKDDLPNVFKSFQDNCSEFIQSGKIKMHRGYTQNRVNDFEDESFDIILIDADHSYVGVSRDFGLYKSKVKKDGLIVFHDYGDWMWTGIGKFVNERISEGNLHLLGIMERLAVCKL